MTSKARRIVAEMFDAFMQEPRLLPPDYQVSADECRNKEHAQARKVADYIAGMTDRYAMREHRRLFAVDDAN
jgi:dGTPase